MKKTGARGLVEDKRIRAAKALVLEALREHQSGIRGIRPAEAGLEKQAHEKLERLSQVRGGSLWYPYLASGLGNGPLVELIDGSVKYDFITGIGVHFLGHQHPDFVEAGLDAALADTLMQGNLQQDEVAGDVMQSLLNLANEGKECLHHCFLTTSGAMANENALKLAFHHRPGRTRLLAFERAFAGRSLALSQVTDKAAYRAGLPTMLAVDYLPFFDAADPDASLQKTLSTLRQHLARHPGAYAAMVLELVQGEGGYYPGQKEFFVHLCRELRQAGVCILMDEIQTFGRTGRPFAFQEFELEEYVDLVTVGKMTQVCATLFSGAFKPPPGLISQTFTSSTSALYGARVLLTHLRRGVLFGPDGANRRWEKAFADRMETLSEKLPGVVHGPFGAGSMAAFTVADGSLETTRKFLQELFHRGVIGFLAGANPYRVRFLLPVPVLEDRHFDEAMQVVEECLRDLFAVKQLSEKGS